MITLGISDLDPHRGQAASTPAIQALLQAAAWCSHRMGHFDRLRSRELDLSDILGIPVWQDSAGIEPYLQAKRQSYIDAISSSNKKREALLRDARTPLPTFPDVQARGKLLLYEPLETVTCGAASAVSYGFYDEEDAPPWDTWFLYFNGTIFSYVPDYLVTVAQAGIDANPVDCIHWGNWRDLP